MRAAVRGHRGGPKHNGIALAAMGTCETPYAGSAGIIWGLLTGQDPLDTVEPVAASGCLKHSMAADFNLVGFEEIQALVGADG